MSTQRREYVEYIKYKITLSEMNFERLQKFKYIQT